MFDPTAFDNMKVVLEGSLYDLDLDGVISIIDRNDLVNIAKLSRNFEVCFQLSGKETKNTVSAKFFLRAELENLAAELLSPNKATAEAGCHLELVFYLRHKNDTENFLTIKKILSTIWGDNRIISQMVKFNPFEESVFIENEVSVTFNRIIEEDQLDDLSDVISHMVETLHQLEHSL